MAVTPARAAENHNQRIVALRAALRHAVSELAFAAGREAATDPKYSGRLLAVTQEMEDVLSRTAT